MTDNVLSKNTSEAQKLLLLDGRKLRDVGCARLKAIIDEGNIKPTLVIIQVGTVAESGAYIEQKKKFAEKIGAAVLHKMFLESVSEGDLIRAIEEFNQDSSIHGVIVQLPIPERLDKQKIIDTIVWRKDVDGLTSTNKEMLDSGDKRAIIPATARGVLSLLQGYGITVAGKKATVIGRSALVGAPIATLLSREEAVVTVCHKETVNVPELSRQAEILVVAIGQPKFINHEYVSAGQVVVDVGINSVTSKPLDSAQVEKLDEEIPKRELVGDVDFEEVKGVAAAISPVPGGVGPMTVLSLFENLLEAADLD
ncbi:MAG: bifunctional 5,10-methylenetetrahydrofolate dehydrogenase/5,10-methenyltetrahydrofolate cyclohydrolase [bacterium]|nr:bifunctional 5,10-methylenetetrahydrofolate dehydrogenase/5,10-methenyltetrahydrofolate cyclohydrolase [bacterium]